VNIWQASKEACFKLHHWPHGVRVSTLHSESNNRGPNPREAYDGKPGVGFRKTVGSVFGTLGFMVSGRGYRPLSSGFCFLGAPHSPRGKAGQGHPPISAVTPINASWTYRLLLRMGAEWKQNGSSSAGRMESMVAGWNQNWSRVAPRMEA
jgi:hypothetical protein